MRVLCNVKVSDGIKKFLFETDSIMMLDDCNLVFTANSSEFPQKIFNCKY